MHCSSFSLPLPALNSTVVNSLRVPFKYTTTRYLCQNYPLLFLNHPTNDRLSKYPIPSGLFSSTHKGYFSDPGPSSASTKNPEKLPGQLVLVTSSWPFLGFPRPPSARICHHLHNLNVFPITFSFLIFLYHSSVSRSPFLPLA